MAVTVDLRTLRSDEFVLHFEGRTNEVDAFTFSNALLAFAEALRETSRQLNPDSTVEVVIEASGPGSYRTKVKTKGGRFLGLIRTVAKDLVVPVFAAVIVDEYLGSTEVKITVDADSYVVERGRDRIILPKSTYDAKEQLPHPELIQEHVARAFDVMQEDPSLTEFGIVAHMNDAQPVAVIPRADFSRMAALAPPAVLEEAHRRHVDERVKITILKAIFEQSERKWQFVWNGIRISAPIRDPDFFARLAAHEYEFGQGDVLDVDLRIHQVMDSIAGAFINERYEVIKVHGHERGPTQADLLRGLPRT